MTEMNYDMLLGHIGLYDEGKKLHSMKEVADFIHTHDCGYIAEADGTPLLEFENGEIDECTDMRFRDELMAELRKRKSTNHTFMPISMAETSPKLLWIRNI